MTFKFCKKCNANKLLYEFNKNKSTKDGLQFYCKACLCEYRNENKQKRTTYRKENKERIAKKSKEYRELNKEKRSLQRKAWYIANKEREKEYTKAYIEANKEKFVEYFKLYSKGYYKNNRELLKNRSREYYENNKTKCISQNMEYRKKRIKTDPKFRLNRIISCAINTSLNGSKKGRRWESLVGYTLNDLVKRLKSTLPSEYTWENYVSGSDLHIDHIVPISVHNFKTTDDNDFKRCWALDNLRLLTAQENIAKGAKLDRHFQPSLF